LEQVNKVTIPFLGQPLEFVHILLQPFIFFANLLLAQLSIGSAIDLQSTFIQRGSVLLRKGSGTAEK
jgi:hypothetical protein